MTVRMPPLRLGVLAAAVLLAYGAGRQVAGTQALAVGQPQGNRAAIPVGLSDCPTPGPTPAHCPALTVRFPHQIGCHYQLKIGVNNGYPTLAVCLLEGHGFYPNERVHLSYGFSVSPVPVVQKRKAVQQWERSYLTPLPHVTCLMRTQGVCQTISTDRQGRFGPIWFRFSYLLGAGGGFEIRVYGLRGDRASLSPPSSRVVP